MPVFNPGPTPPRPIPEHKCNFFLWVIILLVAMLGYLAVQRHSNQDFTEEYDLTSLPFWDYVMGTDVQYQAYWKKAKEPRKML